MDFKEKIIQSLEEAVKDLTGEDIRPPLEHPTEPSHGDCSTNIAMIIAKKQGKNPLELAEEIAKKMREMRVMGGKVGMGEIIEKIEVVPPGFINFWLSQEVFGKELEQALKVGERYGNSESEKREKIAVEHTSPNTNKPLHIGHVRNNVLSMAVIRLLQAIGNEVFPVEIINDRGIHINKSMMGYLFAGQKGFWKNLKNRDDKSRQEQFETMVKQGKFAEDWKVKLNNWVNNKSDWVTPEYLGERGDRFVGMFYVESGKIEEKFTNYGECLQSMLQEWEDGNKEIRDLWKQMNDWFYEGVKETYARLGSLPNKKTWKESGIYQKGKDIVEKNLGKIFKKQEDGSVIADLAKYNLPNPVVLRSDGTSIYMTQDIVLLKDRIEKLQADKLLYVVASEQALHFRQLFIIVQELGYGKLDDFHHLSYGMVRLTTGPMSSRLGTVIDADDLMDQAVVRAKEIIDNAQISKNVNDAGKLAEQVGIGAIKYTILKYHPAGDIIFDPKTSISLDGESGPYLQYTFARTQSVLERASTDYGLPTTSVDSRQWTVDNLEPEELALLRHFYKFSEVVQESAEKFSPNLLCNFLFELAQRYNTFYNKHRILDSGIVGARRHNKHRILESGISDLESREKEPKILNSKFEIQSFRLALTEITGNILKTGLGLLGIEAPERM